jgi:hypothetical protein
MELENIIVSEFRFRSKITFSLICGLETYNKCSNIIEHESHTKRRMHTGGIGKGKKM